MERNIKITVYTQTYNAGIYIKQCIESILNQTYGNFEYIIADHGSNDSTCDIIQEYCFKDKRIKYYRYDHNADIDLIRSLRNEFEGDYYTVVDQDDWIELNYLETLLNLAVKYNADIVNTGSVFFNDTNDELSKAQLSEPLIINKEKYDKYFSKFHWFYRQYWGKLVKTNLLKSLYLPKQTEIGITYGIDTYTSFSLLNESKRIYVDNSVLHHYRIHNKSQTHSYTKNQSYSDIYLHNFFISFLSQYGTISTENQNFLYQVYLNSLNNTLEVLLRSVNDKKMIISEVISILNRDVTLEVYTFIQKNLFAEGFDYDSPSLTKLDKLSLKVYGIVFLYIFKFGTEYSRDNYSELERLLSRYLGIISKIVTHDSFVFWVSNDELRRNLIFGNKTELICEIAQLISKNKYTKKYDLESWIKILSKNDEILFLITDKQFVRKYYDIYILTAQKEYMSALDSMTKIISENNIKITETFINHYMVLSALLEKADEFVKGKKFAAKYYLIHKHYDKCEEMINDLVEMGFECDEDVTSVMIELQNVK